MNNTQNIDKSNKLKEEIFSYKITKDNKVLIYWNNRQAAILSGNRATKFIMEIENVDEYEEQLLMVRVTGNFINRHMIQLLGLDVFNL